MSPPPITLWYAVTAEVAGEALVGACSRVLSEEEETRRRAFLFEKNRHEYLVTRALCRGVLATYTGVPPAELAFTRSPYGQPFLDPPGALRFSLTNTVRFVACGVATERPLGIDAEPLDRGDDILGVADTVFTRDERAELARLPLASRRLQAVRLWTLKEAYMKARGMGFHLPPETFEVRFDPHPRLHHVDDGDRPARWALTTRQVHDHVVATCIERDDAAGPTHERGEVLYRAADLAALLA